MAAPVSPLGGIFNVENVSKIGSLILLALLAILPITVYLFSSFQIHTEAGAVGFTLSNYVRTFTQPKILSAIWNTLIIAFGTAFFSSIVGVALAWFHARTDMPLRGIMEPLTLIPFFLSSFLGAIAWWALAAPRTGMLNRWMIDLFGLSGPPFNIYSMTGIVMVLALFYIPYMYLFTIGSLNRMDPALEESARVCGTGVLRTALRVTIPLSTPAILSGAIIIFVVSLMLIAVVGLYVQRKIVAPRSYVTVTGKGFRPHRVSLGNWKYAAMALNLLYILMAVILPLGALFLASLNRAWLGGFRWSQLSFYNWDFILFSYDYAIDAMKNSLSLGFIGGFMTVVLCTFLSMVILRGKNRKLSSVVDYVSTLPIGVPGLVMGMAFLITWINTPLYSFPLFLLMLAYMTRYLPYGLRTITSVLQSLSPELEESSRVCGATFLGTIRKVTVPLLRPGIFAAYLMLFIMFIRELPVSALLATEDSTPMAVALYVISENEALGVVSAFALVQAVLLLIGTVIFRRLGNIEKLSV